jgi:hypothetical protein
MAKKTQRARKRLPKAKPAAGEATAHSLTGSAVTDLFAPPAPSSAPGAFAFLASAVDPFTDKEHCWGSAVNLFSKIEQHHGVEAAKRMFLALAAPSDRQRQTVEGAMLWVTYEIFRKQHKGLGLKKAAKLISKWFELGGGNDLPTPDTVLQRLKRLQRKRREKS